MAITRFDTPTLITNASGTADIGAAGNGRLVVIVAFRERFSTPPEALTGVTVDGKNATLQKKDFLQVTTSTGIEVWSIHEDQLGASAGSVTCAIQGGNNNWGFVVAVRYGVAQRDAVATYSATNTNSTTVDLTGVSASAGDLVLMAAAQQEDVAWSSYTAPLVEQFDDDFNPEGAEKGQGGIADAILATGLTRQTLTATSSVSGGRLVAVGCVWARAGAIDANDGGGRIVHVVDTRKRERAEEQARRERDARRADLRRTIDRALFKAIDGLPRGRARGDGEVTRAVQRELTRQGFDLKIRDIAAMIAALRRTGRARRSDI